MYVRAVQTRGQTGLQIMLELEGNPEGDTQTTLQLLQAWRNGHAVGLRIEVLEGEPASSGDTSGSPSPGPFPHPSTADPEPPPMDAEEARRPLVSGMREFRAPGRPKRDRPTLAELRELARRTGREGYDPPAV